MKKLASVAIVALGLILSGCSSHYVMTTQDGRMIMTANKPIIDKETGLIQYTDESGNVMQINSDEVSTMIKR